MTTTQLVNLVLSISVFALAVGFLVRFPGRAALIIVGKSMLRVVVVILATHGVIAAVAGVVQDQLALEWLRIASAALRTAALTILLGLFVHELREDRDPPGT